MTSGSSLDVRLLSDELKLGLSIICTISDRASMIVEKARGPTPLQITYTLPANQLQINSHKSQINL